MAIEEPSFKITQTDGDIQLREYSSVIVAETRVEGAFDQASNEGFRRIGGYIFGANRGATGSGQKISMTAPVGVEPSAPQKIAMTVPVATEKGQGALWTIRFTMPAEYTIETLPKPNDSRVALRKIPDHTVAAYRYSGTWSLERFEERKQKLLAWLKDHGFVPEGEAVFARYNPPWFPWFLRRNEVLIPVKAIRP